MLNAGTIQAAANIRTGSSQDITLPEFLEVYPQFTNAVPQPFLEMTLAQANEAISENRWHTKRKFAVCLYVAHFATLWLKSSAGLSAASEPATVARQGEASGNVQSKSVGGVSVSYGSAEGSSDLTGWGSWKETEFGLQLATMAKLVGMGMMVVK